MFIFWVGLSLVLWGVFVLDVKMGFLCFLEWEDLVFWKFCRFCGFFIVVFYDDIRKFVCGFVEGKENILVVLDIMVC